MMKDWFRKNKWKVVLPVLVLGVLAAAFYYGGAAPGLQGWNASAQASAETSRPAQLKSEPAEEISREIVSESTTRKTPEEETQAVEETASGDAQTKAPAETKAKETQPAAKAETKPAETSGETGPSGDETRPGGTEGGMSADEKLAAAAKLAGESSDGVEQGSATYSAQQGMILNASTGKDQYLTEPVPEGKPVPMEPQNAVITDKACTCTISISCATINDNIDWLDPEKVELVPEDGWLLEPTQVTFYEGESVFNVLLRTCKQQAIHMEYKDTPIYNSAYIEGIGNLYEFDCGELSGWMYKVNDWFPNYGCSRYALQDGDVIEWVYTCNLGVDVGGYYAAGG